MIEKILANTVELTEAKILKNLLTVYAFSQKEYICNCICK